MNPDSRSVILLGPPGVGKGTQGALLEEATGWTRIATGDLLREACREGTALGREAQNFMDAGQLVPDQVIIGLMREVLAALGPDQGVIFDGFPRTVPQAVALGDALAEDGRSLDRVLVLEAPDDVLVDRISGRRVHPSSGRVYHVLFDPPQVEERDDETGEPLIQREDDREETVRRRLEIYRRQTEPVIAWYSDSGAAIVTVNGAGGVDEIQDSLRTELGLDGLEGGVPA